MPKQLLIIRHATATWPRDIKSDFERPLSMEGIDEALAIGVFLQEKNIIPEYVLCSSARRTASTLQLINKQLQLPVKNISLTKKLYESYYKDLIEVVGKLDNKYQKVALIGHNNGISDLINYLLDESYVSLPPAGIALLEFPFDDWKMISKGLVEMKLLHFPS